MVDVDDCERHAVDCDEAFGEDVFHPLGQRLECEDVVPLFGVDVFDGCCAGDVAGEDVATYFVADVEGAF